MTTNVEESVRARLRNKMVETGLEFQFLLTRYACERFLYRLGASPIRDRCILKGASLLAVWMDEPYRATRDLDVLALGQSDQPYVRQVVATICGVPCPEDAITFDPSNMRVFPIRTRHEQPSHRVKLTGRLGSVRTPFQVDFGFGDVVVPGPDEVRFPTLRPDRKHGEVCPDAFPIGTNPVESHYQGVRLVLVTCADNANTLYDIAIYAERYRARNPIAAL